MLRYHSLLHEPLSTTSTPIMFPYNGFSSLFRLNKLNDFSVFSFSIVDAIVFILRMSGQIFHVYILGNFPKQ